MKPNNELTYPPARHGNTVDDYHGTRVKDPFRWLEDPDDPETKSWTTAQNQLTSTFLEKIEVRQQIQERLTVLWDFPKYETLEKKGDTVFFTRNEGLQNQAVLYKKQEDEPESVLLDPNTLSDDGTIALILQHYSEDGTLLAFNLSSSGSDWQEIHILDTTTGKRFDEILHWTKFGSAAWKKDNSGFFYNRLPEQGTDTPDQQKDISQVFWHSLGNPQENDRLIFEYPEDTSLLFFPETSDDGKYLLIYSFRGTDRRNGLFYKPIEGDQPVEPLLPDGEAKYIYIGNHESRFYFHTDLGAPNGKVIIIDLENPGRENWIEHIPEGDDAIQEVHLVNDHFVTVLLHDAYNEIVIHDMDGNQVRKVNLPTMGTVEYRSGGHKDESFFFSYTSFLYPATIFEYNLKSHTLTPFHDSPIGFDTSLYETRQEFYKSKDGTRVPLFLTHKKSLELDGMNPTILYGYGGFTLSQTPFFNVWNLLWMEMGGVFALANIRGGTEYGEEWHQAGMMEKKQNVFDDFISAAEWLIKNQYTNPKKLAIEGRSNGGLLVAATMLQRPELFGAVLCHVPVADMLRYHRFTIGHYWAPEYGNAEENPENFGFLYAYSPLHNVREGVSYPPIIITTADTDDRVVPAHSKKFTAELQSKTPGENPVLLRVETKAGHKLGKPTYKLIEEHADVLAFAFHALGMEID